MISTKKQVQDLFKRLDKLDTKGIKVMLDMITDLDESNIYFTIKAVDRYNNVIEQETFSDIPREYLDRYMQKYNKTAEVQVYKKVNGELIKSTI